MRIALLAALLAPLPALAGPVLDARADLAARTDADAPDLGTGVGARVGLPIDLALITLTPEAGLAMWTGAGLLVPDVGARASLGAGLQPGAYAHLLFPMPTPGGPSRGWDAGARLDLTLLPVVDVGAHLGLMGFSGPGFDATRYVQAGIDVGFSF